MRTKKHKGVYPRVMDVLDFAEANPGGKGGIRVVTADLIAQATAAYPGCKCVEEHGLIPGLSLVQVNQMSAGCTASNGHTGPGWVCPALDKLRRLMGH